MNHNDYLKAVDGMEQYGQVLRSLVEELLVQNNIQFQYVAYRVKNSVSTSKKLTLKAGKYSGVQDITDLLGIRIVTYFPKDVDRAASILRKEFSIDEGNSIDKRKLLNPDSFGYLSLHFVASLSASRSQLAEYRRFATVKFEIQIRSVLQHAWAEIEHDLGYKVEGALPDQMRRSFSRLAGMLELADEEFERLREELNDYDKHVKKTITKSPQTLSINQSTLIAAIKSEKILKELDKAIADIEGTTIEKKITPTYMGNRASDLKTLGINNLDQLLKTVDHYENYIKAFANKWLKRSTRQHPQAEPFPQGIGLFYLDYILAAQAKDINTIKWRPYMSMGRVRATVIEEMREKWNQVVKENGEPEPFDYK
jgi:ppGpp synthetase/RelA/SpoT-type nucleotidyltranferase